jgi:hypothetical protein
MIPKSVKRFSDKIMLGNKHDPEKCEAGFRTRSCSGNKHDPEKCEAVFGQDHAPATSMIPKSAKRFSDKIMLRQRA